MLDKESLDYLKTIYERNVITVSETNRLTGYDEGVSNPVTGMLLRNHYIEYVLGEYMMNTDGQWVDVDSSFRITPEGRAYVESTNEHKQDVEPKQRDCNSDNDKKLNPVCRVIRRIAQIIGVLAGITTIAISVWQLLVHYGWIE